MKGCSSSVIIFTRLLFLVVLPLLLLSLAVAFLGLQVVIPELVGVFAVDVGEDDLEDIRVPGHGLAFDAFLDVLRCVSIFASADLKINVPRAALASRSCYPVGK